jgi:hypothetical protein
MTTEDTPIPGSRWRHKSGTVYTVYAVTNLAATRPDEYPPTVVYSSDKGEWWSRPLAKWHSSMDLIE